MILPINLNCLIVYTCINGIHANSEQVIATRYFATFDAVNCE